MPDLGELLKLIGVFTGGMVMLKIIQAIFNFATHRDNRADKSSDKIFDRQEERITTLERKIDDYLRKIIDQEVEIKTLNATVHRLERLMEENNRMTIENNAALHPSRPERQ